MLNPRRKLWFCLTLVFLAISAIAFPSLAEIKLQGYAGGGVEVSGNLVKFHLDVDKVISGPSPCTYINLLIKADFDVINRTINFVGHEVEVYGRYYEVNGGCYVYVEESYHYIKVVDGGGGQEKYSLFVRSNVDGFDLYINNKFAATEDRYDNDKEIEIYDIPKGTTLTLRLEKEGYKSASKTVTVTKDGMDVYIPLEKEENQPPIADFSYSPAESPVHPKVGETVRFTDKSRDPDGRIVSWRWEFGDGGTSVDQNPSHSYSGDGQYKVCLTVTDEDRATDEKCINIPVVTGEAVKFKGTIVYYEVRFGGSHFIIKVEEVSGSLPDVGEEVVVPIIGPTSYTEQCIEEHTIGIFDPDRKENKVEVYGEYYWIFPEGPGYRAFDICKNGYYMKTWEGQPQDMVSRIKGQISIISFEQDFAFCFGKVEIAAHGVIPTITTFTDANGNFMIELPNPVDFSSLRSAIIEVTIYSESRSARINPDASSPPYSSSFHLNPDYFGMKVLPDGTLDLGTMRDETLDPSLAALLEGFHKAFTWFAREFEQVEVRYPVSLDSAGLYDGSEDVILIADHSANTMSEYRNLREVAVHEYAHYAMDQLSRQNWGSKILGYAKALGCVLTGKFEYHNVYDYVCSPFAYSEGWAEFITAVIEETPYARADYPYHIEYATRGFSETDLPWGKPLDPSAPPHLQNILQNEGRVAATLFDIVDPPNESYDHMGTEADVDKALLERIFTIVSSGIMTMNEFWQQWEENYGVSPELEEIIEHHFPGSSMVQPSTKTVPIRRASPQEPARVYFDDKTVQNIEIMVNATVYNETLSLTETSVNPVPQDPFGEIYRYLDMEITIPTTTVETAIITFKVSKPWLENQGASKENVAMQRYDSLSQEWEELPTRFLRESGDDLIFEAESSSFSLYAITVKTAAPPPPMVSSIEEAVAGHSGNPSLIDDPDILWAIDLWINGEPVPGTDGQVINDDTILELIELWISGRSTSLSNSKWGVDALDITVMDKIGAQNNWLGNLAGKGSGVSDNVNFNRWLTAPLAEQSINALSSLTSALKTDTAENDLVKITRELPSEVQAGDTFDVTVTVKAKTDLDLVGVNDTLPPEFVLVRGDTTAFSINLEPEDTFTNRYEVRILGSASPETYEITSTVKALSKGGQSKILTFNSNLIVGGVGLSFACNYAGSDKMVSGSEMIGAIQDYAAGQITGSQLIQIIQYYSTEIPCDQPLTGNLSAGVSLTLPVKFSVNRIALSPNPVDGDGACFKVEGQGIENIQVQIFNLAGRQVFDSGFVAGRELSWNLLNNQGQALANGVYLYVVTVRGFNDEMVRSEVKKLFILR